MGQVYWQPQKDKKRLQMKQREEHFLLHKGSQEKKKEERSSQEVMNITLLSLPIKLPNSQNPWVWINFPVKTSERAKYPV